MQSRLGVTESLPDKIFLGSNVGDLETGDVPANITRVNLSVDSDHYYTAGDDTGRAIEVTCPWGSQEMANSILASVSGKTYQPYTATDALLDPAAEIGDAVTVGGYYSVIANASTSFDRACAPIISAPESDEIDDEYPYESKERRETNRQLAQTRSLISKTSEEIMLSVESQINSMSASFTVQLNNISSRVTGLSGEVSSIEQYVDSITLNVSNGSTSSTIQLKAGSATISSQTITMSGLVTFTGLSSGTTTINGACIKTGTIEAERLNLTGAITFNDLAEEVYYDINDAYTMAEDAQKVVGGWVYPGTTQIDGNSIMTGTVRASTLEGGYIALLSSSERTVGELTMTGASTATYAVDLYSYGALRLTAGSGAAYIEAGSSFIELDSRISCGNDIAPSVSGGYSCGISSKRWSDVYADNAEIQTSDQNKKHDIEELPEKYLEMMDRITPVRYRLNDGTSGRFHVGFVAQEVEQAMTDAKVGSLEFGGWVKDTDEEGNDIYMLRYSEFIAVLWAKIRQLESRLEAMA